MKNHITSEPSRPPMLITDKAVCQKMLVQAGLAGHIEALHEGCNMAQFVDKEATVDEVKCYFIARYYYGFENPEDNGYLIFIVPHSFASEEWAMQAAEALIGDCKHIEEVSPVSQN